MNYRKKVLWIYLSAALLTALLLAYGVGLIKQVGDTKQAWVDYSEQAVLADEALHRISGQFGYGGFIHNFKNYVLRQDQTLEPMLEQDLTGTYLAIKEYQSLKISRDEQQALVQLRAVVDEYAQKYRQAKHLVNERMPPREIDRKVKVDDTPGLQAIATLNAFAETQALRKRYEMGEALSEIIEQIAYGGVLVILVFMVAAVLADDRRRLAQATERLAQTRRYFIQLLEATPDAIMVADGQGRIIRVNLEAERLFGYTREQLLEKFIEDLMPERFRHGHAAIRSQAFDATSTRSFGPGSEFPILTSDGREVPAEISLSYSIQSTGKQAIISLRDISERKRLEKKLRQQHAALQTAQAITHLGSWDWDVITDKLSWSDEIYRIFGLEPQCFPATYDAFLESVHPADRAKVRQAVQDAIASSGAYQVEHRVVRPDGTERFVYEQAKVSRDAQGEAIRMVGTVQDITERKAYEQELLLDQAIIEKISQPILITDSDKRIVDMNDAFCEMSGYQREELMGKTPAILKSGRHDKDYYEDMWSAMKKDGHWHNEMWLRHKGGEALLRLMTLSRVCDEDAAMCRYVAVYSDISELKENEARLETLAHFDHLTGLANRMLCHDRLRAAIARARRSKTLVAVFYLDLDGFKTVNDRLGHQAGDELLVEAAKQMEQCVREEDTVARLGGDEFIIVLSEVESRDKVAELALRILKKLQVTVSDGDEQLMVSGSLGIALYPDDGDDLDVLLAHADQAMYQAKAWGRNRFVFYDQA